MHINAGGLRCCELNGQLDLLGGFVVDPEGVHNKLRRDASMMRIICYVENCQNHKRSNECILENLNVAPKGKVKGTDDSDCLDFQPKGDC